MDLRSFFGILQPKLPYADKEIPVEDLQPPSQVILTWKAGAPGDLMVRAGGQVKTGQNLARNGKGPFISTATGRIEAIDCSRDHGGGEVTTVVLSAQSRDNFDPCFEAVQDFSKPEPSELLTAIEQAGFAGFGSIIKAASKWPLADNLIISALDLDPMSTANQQVYRDNQEKIGAAIQLLTRATGATQRVLAVPAHLAHLAKSIPGDAVVPVMVPPEYPNGLPEILSKKYGGGTLLQSTNGLVAGNTIVIGVEDAVKMLDCLQEGKPLVDKIVTFSQSPSEQMKNFRVRIGTPVVDILAAAGGELKAKSKLIVNGVMRGYSCFSDEQPVTETTESVHVQGPHDIFFFENTACTNCGKCNSICPVDLEANLLARLSEYGVFDKCRPLGAENCIECGLCAYVCPARRPLVQLISHAKQVIANEMYVEAGKEEDAAGDASGPACPSVRLFESVSDEGQSPRE